MNNEVLSIAAAAYEAVLAHCVKEWPREAVGLLSGHGGVALQSHALRNIAPPPHDRRAFLAAPYDQFRTERRIAAAGLDVTAVYHSHPDGGAALSAEDAAASGKQDRIQVVVALNMSPAASPLVRAFRRSAEGNS